MNAEAMSRVNQKVIRQFPEMAGVDPQVRSQKTPDSHQQFLLTYQGSADLPGGRTLKRIVRVVADSAGRVIRISTSR